MDRHHRKLDLGPEGFLEEDGHIIDVGGRKVFHGHVKFFHPNGKKAEVMGVVLGMASGLYNAWYDDGKPSVEGMFANGTEVGKWTYFTEDGKTTTIIHGSRKK